MSYIRRSSRLDMPYGGMPYDEIFTVLDKLPKEDNGEIYDEFARTEITDWNSDPTFHESDNARSTRRAGSERLNTLYNATRGSVNDFPMHPELFIGFTDKDPRGTENNPVFYGAREFMEHRHEIFANMPNNGTTQLNERPWTQQSLNASNLEQRARQKIYTKIFHRDYENLKQGISAPLTVNPNKTTRPLMASSNDTKFAKSNENSMRQVSYKSDNTAWHKADLDGELGIQKYANTNTRQRNVQMNILSNVSTDGEFSDIKLSRSTNKPILGAAMAIGAMGDREHSDINFGNSDETISKSSNISPQDIAQIYNFVQGDQSKSTSTKSMSRGGIVNPKDVSIAARSTEQNIKYLKEYNNSVKTIKQRSSSGERNMMSMGLNEKSLFQDQKKVQTYKGVPKSENKTHVDPDAVDAEKFGSHHMTKLFKRLHSNDNRSGTTDNVDNEHEFSITHTGFAAGTSKKLTKSLRKSDVDFEPEFRNA